jgi:hypothetical protein
MIKTLYINGCSHTAGVELDSWEKGGPSWPKDGTIQDIPQHCYNDSWANTMGRNLNVETIINNSIPGSSNDHILQSTIDFVQRQKNKKELFVLIGWTGSDRLFLESDEPGDNKFLNHYMFIPGLLGAKKSESVTPMKDKHEVMYKELLRTHWGSWTEIQYRTILQHFTLQSFLQKHNIKHLFINMLFDFDLHKINKVPKLNALYNLLDHRNIYKECYFERFKKDPNTVWNPNQHVGQPGQNEFAKEVHNYIKENDLLLR